MDMTSPEKHPIEQVLCNKKGEGLVGITMDNNNQKSNNRNNNNDNNKNNNNRNNNNSSNNNSSNNCSNSSSISSNEDSSSTCNKSTIAPNRESEFNMSVFEDKFQEFVMKTEKKFDMWMETTLRQFQDTQNEMINVVQECVNCQALQNRYDKALKLNMEQEKEVLALKDEAKMKDSMIHDLKQEIKSLSKELNASNNRLSDLSVASNSSGFEAKIIQMEIMTSKQNLQIAALQEQNNVFAAQNKLKDQVISSKQKEIDNLSQQMQKRVVDRSREVKFVQDDHQCGGDVILIHDLPPHRRFNIALLKSDKTTVTEIWATRLNDALTYVRNMERRPKVVIIHTGSEDLARLTEDEIVALVVEIYDELYRKEVKLIWSNILPVEDDFEVKTKGYFVNVKVGKELSLRPDAYVGRMEDFSLREMLNDSILNAIEEKR